MAVAMIDGGDLVGLVSGSIRTDVTQLDSMIAGDGPDPERVLASLVEVIEEVAAEVASSRVELWARPAMPWHQALADARSLPEVRTLHQMRCSLPVAVDPVPTRAFEPDDLDTLRQINNRAFATHPDQGTQTNDSLRATMAEPWFDPDGLRLHEHEGRVVGFCWTRIHPPRSSPTEPGIESDALGEIYVIGLDPDVHGQGLGGPMTAAGLHWLHQQGLTTGMLYVEAENLPAVKTYEGLGFSVVRTDRAWLLS
jgi:mycothiol synthase